MPYQYTNRRGEVYYVHTKQRGGRVGYTASRKPAGKSIDRLPEGYEIYERPENAQVFVRKIKATRILPIERELIEASIREQAELEYFIVEVEADSLVVYLTDTDPDAAMDLIGLIAPMTPDTAREMKQYAIGRARYEKMMRFVLTEEPNRKFAAERWCFLGGIDDWYFLDGDQPLSVLADKYVRHLGRESFFDLM
ncbi:MAG: hypothetical protein WBD40_06840 [Tepidisphaeraceae bacterium]